MAQREAVITLVKHGWGKDSPIYRQIFSEPLTPSATPEELDWFNDFQRQTVSPTNAVKFRELFSNIDVRHRLAELDLPTLVSTRAEISVSAWNRLESWLPPLRALR